METTSPLLNAQQQLALDTRSLNGLGRLAKQDERSAIQAAAKEFEAVFIGILTRQMRQALPESGLFSSTSTGAYQDLYDQQLAKSLSSGRGLGLADMLTKHLTRRVDLEKGMRDLQKEVVSGSENTQARNNSLLRIYAE